MPESEREIRKLYIVAHANPILYMLPELFTTIERAGLGCAVWSGVLRGANCSCCHEH